MNSGKIFGATFFVMTFFAGCSSNDQNKSELADTNQKPELIGTHYTTVVFEKGKTTLSRNDKEQLNKLADKAHNDKREIDEIRILAWSDEEYPDPSQKKAPQSEIILAANRAHEIKEYFEQDLEEYEDIDAYNMARRPDFLSKLLRNDEYFVKEAFEGSGATGTKLANGKTSYSKASKALVIIDYEGDEDNLK